MRPIVKCDIDMHNGTLACLEPNLLSRHWQVSSRSPAIISEAFERFLGNPLRLLCSLSNAIAGFHLAESTESFVSSK